MGFNLTFFRPFKFWDIQFVLFFNWLKMLILLVRHRSHTLTYERRSGTDSLPTCFTACSGVNCRPLNSSMHALVRVILDLEALHLWLANRKRMVTLITSIMHQHICGHHLIVLSREIARWWQAWLGSRYCILVHEFRWLRSALLVKGHGWIDGAPFCHVGAFELSGWSNAILVLWHRCWDK